MRSAQIPTSLQGVLWSTHAKNLDAERDKNYIIHQTLMYGTLEQLRWLIRLYGIETVRRVFVEEPQNMYTPQAFYFIAKVILGLDDLCLDKRHYVKSSPRSFDR